MAWKTEAEAGHGGAYLEDPRRSYTRHILGASGRGEGQSLYPQPRGCHCRTMAHLLAHGSACQVPAAAARLSQRPGTASAAPQDRLALQRCATAARKLKGMQHKPEGHAAGPRCSVSVSSDPQASAAPTEGAPLAMPLLAPCSALLIVHDELQLRLRRRFLRAGP